MEFHALYPDDAADPAAFETAEAWHAYLRDTGEYGKGRYGYRTLNGELVDSMGERAIANWLYLNGVDHEHERSIERSTGSGEHRQAGPGTCLDCCHRLVGPADVLGENGVDPFAR